ncbi:UDP-N-acetylmuramoyl-L-alanine--D-glutamate ligase [Rubritalea tangerina]|uniref:UDP-N-acetylmuramoylalanine--D-glutamate ligase n=2 Tax=Rubritalea tangerina TaxID=430798 RepID=A0ABW4ZCR7_9BACT
MTLTGKQVIVLGAGRSGRAAATLAHAKGAQVRLYDANPQASFEGLADGIEGFAGASEETGRASQCDYLVISPGIDTYGSFVKAFAENAGALIGETELAYRFYVGKIVGITGTNGKTTTTELVQRILEHSGLSCVACGNYGVPFSEVVMMETVPDAVALELSSFQLETVVEFHADVAIWLNFSADHMDRYTSLDDYFRAKMQIFINQTAADTAVVREGEELGSLVAQHISFSSEGSAADYHLDGLSIFAGGQKVIDLSETRMRGLHNAENVMSAVAACHALGVSYATAQAALQGFAPPMHRCELIRTLDGVEYLNDSKATNLHALDSALRSQSRPVVLLAGGKEKGLEYDELLVRLKDKARCAIVFGEIAPVLHQTFSQVVETESVETLDQAVKLAQSHAQHGDVVLLSPGTSSFDQFAGYEARGDHFRELVHKLR